VTIGSSFQFDVNISAAPDAYLAYQANVQFNPSLLAWDGSPPVETNVGGAFLCGGGVQFVDSLYDGCARISGSSMATGVAFTWGMTCTSFGTSDLHLLTNAEVGDAIGTNFALADSSLVPAVTVDASVTCGAAS
jgi:hypothetical protein